MTKHMLTEFFVAASLLAASAASPVPATPDEFLDRLQASMDFSAAAVTAAVDLSEGVHIDIAYELAGVGHVRLAAYGELDEQAAVILLVDDTTILDFDGAWNDLPEQIWRAFDTDYLATLDPEKAVALFNSLVQVWTTTEVEQALADAAEAAPPRSVLCNVAGGLSGGTIGGAAGAGCWWFSKKLKTCKQVLVTVTTSIFSYIKDKCEGAQN